MAPEYASAAKHLKESGSEVVLAKVDATENDFVAKQFNVEEFPTLIFIK